MNLRRIDLNLLVYFDVLMQMRHVSRAAAYLGVGQPAMSAALGRLRELFEDPLLVRQGHEMVPTQRALNLEAEVKKVLRGIEDVIEPPGDFDPAASTRAFRLRMSDLLTFLALQDFARMLEESAPGITLTVDHFAPDETADALTGDKIDVAISTGLDVTKSIRKADLYEDTVVCIAHRDFDVSGALKSAEAFARASQVRVSQSPLDDRFADHNLQAMGLDRNVRITVPHWLSLPEILCATPLIATVPATFARRIADRHPIGIHPIDIFDTAFSWSIYWHHRYDGDPAHRWLRDSLGDSCMRQLRQAGGAG
ncbi:MAG: LysR family transcriptional regulator [Rhodospirillales bacterium]|nr:LysR family transcriptional regulator [Rhodospirillales bacterium]